LAPLAPRRRAPLRSQASLRYYGRVRLLWSVHRRLGPPAFPARSLQNSARTAQRYPGSRAGGVSACQCLRRRGADLCLAIATWAVLPSAGRKASALRSWFSPLNGWPTLSPVNASLRPSRVAAHDSGSVRFATPSPKRTHMGVFGSSGQVHRHIKKLRWLFRYPRSEPYFMTWLVPHQIKLTSGRRSKQLHQYPAFGGWGSGGRDHSFTRLFKPVLCSVPIAWIRQDRLGPGDWGDCVGASALRWSSSRRPR
jgi:hypothetical protein